MGWDLGARGLGVSRCYGRPVPHLLDPPSPATDAAVGQILPQMPVVSPSFVASWVSLKLRNWLSLKVVVGWEFMPLRQPSPHPMGEKSWRQMPHLLLLEGQYICDVFTREPPSGLSLLFCLALSFPWLQTPRPHDRVSGFAFWGNANEHSRHGMRSFVSLLNV